MAKKNKNSVGRALIKSRFNPENKLGVSNRHSVLPEDTLISITQESDLNEFLNTATLANTDFTAEKLNVNIVAPQTQTNESVSMPVDTEMLRIPRRPPWDKNTTKEQLEEAEKASFLNWRRNLAVLEETGVTLTPYERNLQIWRQLWRVIERSDVVVQIVDARNPLFFRCEDLEKYVHEVNPNKKNLLLVNKADLLSKYQRQKWAEWFKQNDIDFLFFSAALANLDQASSPVETEADIKEVTPNEEHVLSHDFTTTETTCPLSYIHSSESLIELLHKHAPCTIGFIGYPNVGKSSTINTLLASHRTNVSATPGKTKHFQTFKLSESVTLCDCPGLVFPMWDKGKSEMVCNGVLGIDELRGYMGPVSVLVDRIHRNVLEVTYNITIPSSEDEKATPEEFLRSYAISRGYRKAGQGNPDEARAARYILKDYVNGKLLYVFPPPSSTEKEEEKFLRESVKRMIWVSKKRRTEMPDISTLTTETKPLKRKEEKDVDMDEKEVGVSVSGKHSGSYSGRVQIFPHQEKSSQVSESAMGDKKHKKGKRGKTRDNWTKDYDY